MKRAWFALWLIAGSSAPLLGAVRLPAVIGEHAVLQAGRPVAIWGWADSGDRVTVIFSDGASRRLGKFAAQADNEGKWSGFLPAMNAGTIGQLEVKTERGGLTTVRDVAVGEVWLGGGQSNMEYDIAGTGRVDRDDPAEVREVARNIARAKEEAAAAGPAIRYFKARARGKDEPADDVDGAWVLASPATVAKFSAVAWNFGVALREKLRVPIGLVVSCVGNTPIEAWMPARTLDATSAGAAIEERNRGALAAVTPQMLRDYAAALKAWLAANPTAELQFEHRRTRPAQPYSRDYPSVPSRFYNGMIHGLEPYTLRGMLWFQGDGNAAHPEEYSELFHALIGEWREEWGEGALPFYFVELNNMREDRQTRPVQPNGVSLIREAQQSVLSLPGVDLVSAIDLGTKNPHFPNKKTVGERLAALALVHCYGADLPAEGPRYAESSEEGGGRLRLHLVHADGLRIRGGSGPLRGFAVRGAEGPWQWADGKIDGQDIVLWNEHLPRITAARYAWAMNPAISVENGAGLPLSPFRTDSSSKE